MLAKSAQKDALQNSSSVNNTITHDGGEVYDDSAAVDEEEYSNECSNYSEDDIGSDDGNEEDKGQYGDEKSKKTYAD